MSAENSDEDSKNIQEFIQILSQIKKIKEQRKNLVDTIYWEYENHNTDLFQDRDSLISKYIQERKNYPNAFLGSSLGFTKGSSDNKYNEFLIKLKLGRHPEFPSERNCIAFEKLKLLIIKLFEIRNK